MRKAHILLWVVLLLLINTYTYARRVKNFSFRNSFISGLLSKIQTPDLKDARVVAALITLVEKLKDNLDSYDSIISDEAGGRLVALFLRDIINRERAKLGKPSVRLYFISGSRRYLSPETYQEIEKFIQSKKSTLGKILLSTEIVSSGDNITALMQVLKKQEVSFDVSTLSLENKSSPLAGTLIYGEIGSSGLVFHNKSFLGVISGDSLHPGRIPIFSQDEKKTLSQELKVAREDMHILADEIYKLLSQNCSPQERDTQNRVLITYSHTGKETEYRMEKSGWKGVEEIKAIRVADGQEIGILRWLVPSERGQSTNFYIEVDDDYRRIQNPLHEGKRLSTQLFREFITQVREEGIKYVSTSLRYASESFLRRMESLGLIANLNIKRSPQCALAYFEIPPVFR